MPHWALHEYSSRGYVKGKRLGEKGLFATLYAAVRTDMLDATGSAGDLVLKPTAIEPEDVAEALFQGIAEDRFLIRPHGEVADYYRARAAENERWLAGMNHIQRTWEQSR